MPPGLYARIKNKHLKKNKKNNINYSICCWVMARDFEPRALSTSNRTSQRVIVDHRYRRDGRCAVIVPGRSTTICASGIVR